MPNHFCTHYSEYEVLPEKGHVNLAVDKDLVFLEIPMPCCPKKELVNLVVDKDLLLESPIFSSINAGAALISLKTNSNN